MENYNLNQAINFSKDVIFVSIPKCGTNTVRKQLKEFNTNKPVVHNYHLNIQQIKELFYLKELKDNLSMNENFPSSGILNNTEIKNKANNKFNKMFKFSLVRNPWARVVSLYFRREGLQLSEKISFIEFCEKIKYASDTCKQPSLHKNQLDWLTDENGNVMVDYIGKLEEFDKVIENVYSKTDGRVKLNNTPLNVNQKSPKDYKKMYNDYTKKLIEEKFNKDINYFNYNF